MRFSNDFILLKMTRHIFDHKVYPFQDFDSVLIKVEKISINFIIAIESLSLQRNRINMKKIIMKYHVINFYNENFNALKFYLLTKMPVVILELNAKIILGGKISTLL